MSDKAPAQVWEGVIDGRRHRVEMSDAFVARLTWTIDGDQVASGRVGDRRTTLSAGERGRLVTRTSLLGRPRSAIVLGKDDLAGGTELTPAPGSRAAAHQEKVLAHPGRYTALETLGAAGGVVVPIIVFAILARLAFEIPWPDLPSIPWPDLPDINLPSIPWPSIDLPDIAVPGWVETVLASAKYVLPVVVAFVLARGEVRRRRRDAEARDDAVRESAERDGEQPRE